MKILLSALLSWLLDYLTRPRPAPTPGPAPQPPPAPPPAPEGDVEQAVVALFNAERSKIGKPPLKVNPKLTQAAIAHSADMASHRKMTHAGSDGSQVGDRIRRAGYSWSSEGECVAYGQQTPQAVVTSWMNSPPHRAIILGSFAECGVAANSSFWTAVFATAGLGGGFDLI